MKRTITLSEGTQTLINAILDLESISGRVYSSVRDDLSPLDSVDDSTGSDIVEASNNLRDVFQYYLRDRFNFGMSQVSNQNGTQVII